MNKLIDLVTDELDTFKCSDCIIYSDFKFAYITNNSIVASAVSSKQSVSCIEKIHSKLKSEFGIFPRIDISDSKWVFMDCYSHFVLHIFEENERKKFEIDEFLKNISYSSFPR